MAKRIGFSVYKIQVKEPHAREWWQFQNNTASDGFSAVENALQGRLNKLTRLGDRDPTTGNYADDRAVKIARINVTRNARRISGMALQGESGVIRPIYNFDNPDDDPTYTMQVAEGALFPLYFRLYLQDGRRYGIAILQTFGNQGLKGAMETLLHRYTLGPGGRLTVKLTQLLDRSVLEQFARQGKLQDVILINRGKTATSRSRMQATTIGSDGLGDDGDKLELTMHKREGWPARAINALLNAVRRNENPRDLVSTGIGPVDDMLVEIESGGRKQRFSLLNPDDSPIRFDKTDQIIVGNDGLPPWSALERAADEVWNDVQSLQGGTT